MYHRFEVGWSERILVKTIANAYAGDGEVEVKVKVFANMQLRHASTTYTIDGAAPWVDEEPGCDSN